MGSTGQAQGFDRQVKIVWSSWLQVQINEKIQSGKLTVNVLILVRYSTPPGIVTNSRRALRPFCNGQASGSKTGRIPSTPQWSLPLPSHTCLPLLAHSTCLLPAHLPAFSMALHSPAPYRHTLQFLSWNTNRPCDTARGTSWQASALSLFPAPPLLCPSVPAMPPAPPGKEGGDGPRT